MKTIQALVIGLGISLLGSAHAFSTTPLNGAQRKAARQTIRTALSGQVKSIKFGYAPTPKNFIGNGLETATVKLKSGATKTFVVNPGTPGFVSLDN